MSREGWWCAAESSLVVASGKRGRSACPAVLWFYCHPAVDRGSWSSDAMQAKRAGGWVSVGEFCCRGRDGWWTPGMRETSATMV